MEFEIIEVSGLLHKVSTIQGGRKMPTATKPTVVENIQVFQVGKFGVRIDEKNWYNVNAPLTPSHFKENTGYKVALSVAKSGKKYISEILGTEVKADAPAAAAPTTEKVAETPKAAAPAPQAEAPKSTTTAKHPSRAGYDKPLTEYDLAKDRQISRSGLYQAALSSPALAQWAVNVDEYLALVRKVADAGTAYIGE